MSALDARGHLIQGATVGSCPRCAFEKAAKDPIGQLANILRDGPEALDEPDEWADYLYGAGIRVTFQLPAPAAAHVHRGRRVTTDRNRPLEEK